MTLEEAKALPAGTVLVWWRLDSSQPWGTHFATRCALDSCTAQKVRVRLRGEGGLLRIVDPAKLRLPRPGEYHA